MKIKTAELSGSTLSWAVGFIRCMHATEGRVIQSRDLMERAIENGMADYAGNPFHSASLLSQEHIVVSKTQYGSYLASKGKFVTAYGDTHNEAALRCFVKAYCGEQVDVPDRLVEMVAA